jgi:hypothetical protein
MGAYVWPADAVTGAPSYTGRKLRQLLGGLLIGKTSSRPLGGRSGVWPGTSTTTVTISAGNWQVGAHAGALDLETAAEAGPYFYSSDDSPFVGTGVTAADATNSRIDIVYVQLSDPAESDGTSTPGVAFGYLAGSPGSGVPPTTPARSLVLAWLNVPNVAGGGVGSATVTWKAPYTAAAGGTIIVRDLTERNALTAYNGLMCYRIDTDNYERYNSGWGVIGDPGAYTSWTAYTPAWSGEGGGSNSLGTGGTIGGRYKQVGKRCIGNMSILIGTSATGPSGVWDFTLPVTPALLLGSGVDVPIGTAVYYGGTMVIGIVMARQTHSGKFVVLFHDQTAPAQSGNPAGWGAGTRMSVDFDYETT